MGFRVHFNPVYAIIISTNLAFAIVNILLKKVLDGGTNHMVIVTYRLLISTIFLAPIACYWERKTRPKVTADILGYLFVGALLGVLSQYFFLLGLEHTSASFSCAFLSTVPVITFILALPFGIEKLKLKTKAGKAKLLGAVICVGGAVVLACYKGIPLTKSHSDNIIMSEKKTKSWIIGSAFFMVSCIMSSAWFLIQAKVSQKYPSQYSSTTILSLFGAIQAACMSLILDRNIRTWILKETLGILTVIYAGVVGSGLCFVGMAWCVRQRGPVFTAAFTPFAQIFAVILGFSFLHDQIYLGSVIGSILVVVGLYILLWGKSNETEESVTKQSVTREGQNGDVESQAPETINSISS